VVMEKPFDLGYCMALSGDPWQNHPRVTKIRWIKRLAQFEELIENNHTDFISMSRAFIREPYLVKSFKGGNTVEASCISCNKCFAAVFNNIPLNCYEKGIPEKYFE